MRPITNVNIMKNNDCCAKADSSVAQCCAKKSAVIMGCHD